MQRNANPRPSVSLKFLGIVIGLLVIGSCSSNSTTIRIKSDPGANLTMVSGSAVSEAAMNQKVLDAPSKPKRSNDEILESQVNQLFNHYVKAEGLLTEGKLPEAEKELIQANSMVESKEGWTMLIKMYEQAGNQAKADSCKRRLAEFTRIQSQRNIPY